MSLRTDLATQGMHLALQKNYLGLKCAQLSKVTITKTLRTPALAEQEAADISDSVDKQLVWTGLTTAGAANTLNEYAFFLSPLQVKPLWCSNCNIKRNGKTKHIAKNIVVQFERNSPEVNQKVVCLQCLPDIPEALVHSCQCPCF